MINLKEICKALNVEFSESEYQDYEICGITTDTRESCKGKLFIPLLGKNFNGHDYIETAFRKGAVAALSEENIHCGKNNIIKVENTLKALGNIAKYFIEKRKLKIIGITGTAGKTTTKELLKHTTGFQGTKNNFNNLIGVPKTVIENYFNNEKSEYLILELGTNCTGEMEALRNITTPEFVLITNIGYGHIEGLGSLEEVFKEKFSLINGNGDVEKAVVNRKIVEDFNPHIKDYELLTFGEDEKSDICLVSSMSTVSRGNKINFSYKGKNFEVKSRLLGKFNALNILSVFLTAKELGFEENFILSKIESFNPVNMRCEIFKNGNGVTIINDCYNANYDSFCSAVSLFNDMDVKGRKFIVMGDMFELGELGEELHLKLGELIAGTKIEFLLCYGELVDNTIKKITDNKKFVKKFNSKNEIIDFLKKNISDNDAVLIKASRAMKFEEITEGIR